MPVVFVVSLDDIDEKGKMEVKEMDFTFTAVYNLSLLAAATADPPAGPRLPTLLRAGRAGHREPGGTSPSVYNLIV